jgi:hypothetical protein
MSRNSVVELPSMEDSATPQSEPDRPEPIAVPERKEGMRLSEVILRSLPLLGFIVIALVLVELRKPDITIVLPLLILQVSLFVFSILLWIPKSQSKHRQ